MTGSIRSIVFVMLVSVLAAPAGASIINLYANIDASKVVAGLLLCE